MATLTARQGDVLYFARSLIWTVIVMTTNEIWGQPDHVRFEAYVQKLKELRAMGGRITQAQSDQIAAMYNTISVNFPNEDNGGTFAGIA